MVQTFDTIAYVPEDLGAVGLIQLQSEIAPFDIPPETRPCRRFHLSTTPFFAPALHGIWYTLQPEFLDDISL